MPRASPDDEHPKDQLAVCVAWPSAQSSPTVAARTACSPASASIHDIVNQPLPKAVRNNVQLHAVVECSRFCGHAN